MAIFRWQGVGPNGETVKGEMDAPNASVVATRLRLRRIRPLPDRIRAKGRGLESALHIPGLGEKVKQRDVVIFTRQLATMIDAGLPIVQALDLLAQQTENKTFSGVIATLKHDVESGSALAESLAKHPAVFDELYTNMVSAGELGGMLDTILIRLAVYMEKAVKLKAKIKSAMIYPLSVISVAVLVTALLLVYVIPVFGEMFAGFGEEMPLPTQIALNLSSVAIAYFWHMVAGVVGTIVSVRAYYRTEHGRQMIDGVLLRLPVVGDILRKTAVARFTRTLSTLVSSGVPILDSLAITGKTAGNKVVEKAVLAARQSISEGKTLADPLIKSQVFPPMVCQMVQVGETTGALDTMLSKIADFYDDEVDTAASNLTTLVEPVVILFLGVVIGGIIVSMYLPIFQLGSVLN